jgi:hypothetical protein
VEIRAPPGAPFGEVVVQAVRSGPECEVRVSMHAAQVDVAHEWTRNQRPVLVEGSITSQQGRPLRIQGPDRVLPIDETMLKPS